MRMSSRKVLTWLIYSGRFSAARIRDLRVLKLREKSAALRGSVMKEYLVVVFSISSAIRTRGTSGRLVAKRSFSCRICCASVIMPWMKSLWKDNIWTFFPLKVNDSSESIEVDAGMLIGRDGKGKGLYSQQYCVRGRVVGGKGVPTQYTPREELHQESPTVEMTDCYTPRLKTHQPLLKSRSMAMNRLHALP